MKLLYIILFITLPSAIFAQSNYHQGYVLKNNGDTLKGYIDYREWAQNPKSIDFKINKDDNQPLKFTPPDIKGFQVTGMETYMSYTGMISMDGTRFPDLSVGLDTTKQQSSIFLKQLATGDHATLFYDNDENKVRFFITEKNKKPVELKYYQYYTNERDIKEICIYRGQLILYINKFNAGSTDLMKEVARSRYAQLDLEHLVDEINGIAQANSNVKTKKSSNRFFIGAGVNNTQTVYNYTNFATVPTSSTISPKIDLGYDVFVNPNIQKLILRADLSFSYISPRLVLPAAVNSHTNDIYRFNQYTASIVPQLLFNFYNKDNFKVYIDAGVSFNLSAYSNTKIIDPNTGTKDPNEEPYHLESYWANFPLQIGVMLNKKMEFSFTYTGIASYTQYVFSSLSNRSASLGMRFYYK
ncbi:MAG: hypothetical protein JWP78_1709 [Mucilaginibacter sp.]|nr:hypothetical protein [Mucilaginibacter sp.]